MDLIRALHRAWIQYGEFQRVRQALADSSDRQLADMGLARGDIVRLAYEHAEAYAARHVPARTVELSRPAARLHFARQA